MFGKTAQNGGTKPSGMELMIGSILKSMGVSPDQLTGYIEDGKHLAQQFVDAMTGTHKRLAEVERIQTEILLTQQLILQRLPAAPKPIGESTDGTGISH